ncbi:hypothetical protein, partial [Parasulfitobacter algicola]|uniref:hypothetical protein n=1 Tax=Parasulfitobacter algicola TaxID=2614809 RepID=UPI001C2D99C5
DKQEFWKTDIDGLENRICGKGNFAAASVDDRIAQEADVANLKTAIQQHPKSAASTANRHLKRNRLEESSIDWVYRPVRSLFLILTDLRRRRC